MPPTVSVIIPTYNRWPMIGEAVESVLAQSFQDFELIVVDDGSRDGTAKRITALGGDTRIMVQSRCGVSAARNHGAHVARGRYLAFLDSDDLWLAEKLAVQTTFMVEHPEMQICQTEETWLRHGKRVNPKAKHRKPSGDIFRASLELCLVSPSAVMMTKKLFDETGGFDESFSVCEDYDLWLRIAVDHPVPLIAAPLVIKRGGHADQLSHSLWGMDRYRVAALQKLLRAGVGGEKREWVVDTLRRKIAVLAQGAMKRGQESAARAYEAVLGEFVQEKKDVGGGDSRVRQGEGISPANSGAVARLGAAG
ncbi:MAG: glycosyltransferase family 2 protein [Deltaproteobacteria bacterium]|nr:glycosyltransferase family 2 protein [Deltaproteobacteria bacterium]